MSVCGEKFFVGPSFARFLDDESGATAIEYGLIVALIFLAIITAVQGFSDENSAMFDEIQSELQAR